MATKSPTGNLKYEPYVPASTSMRELTARALVLGVLMAIVLGAANAYLGMKVGLTVAATFPAAVVAMAALRIFGGSVLEENLARTTASVGEALVAGAIFTIPAFILAGAWERFHFFDATLIMGIGGVLGVLFVIILRRTLVVEADLPFPESVAAGEIVKAGQGGQTGAGLVFGAMGIAALWELFKNSNGIQIVQETMGRFFHFPRSTIQIVRQPHRVRRGLFVQTPAASPAVIGVGYIVGLRISAVLFAGAVDGLAAPGAAGPLPQPGARAPGSPASRAFIDRIAYDVWFRQIRPLAVGTMIVAAFYTLCKLRTSLIDGIRKAFAHFDALAAAVRRPSAPSATSTSRRSAAPSPCSPSRCSSSTVLRPQLRRLGDPDRRDDRPRLPFRRGRRLSGGTDRQLEQPHLRAHACRPC